MSAPKRIQRRRDKGWRLPNGAIYVGRPTRWGNPYRASRGTVYGPSRPIEGGELVAYSTHSNVNAAIAATVETFQRDIDCAIRSTLTSADIRRHLRGSDLACWCSLSRPCHADILLEIANSGRPR